MPFRWDLREHLALGAYAAKWLALTLAMSTAIGSVVAWFLLALDWATATRVASPWLLYLLPVSGAVVGALYHFFGKDAEGGSNLIVEEIHEPGAGVPGQMAPLVFFGTVATHLCGGSAGREGTAVQMGGSLAGVFAKKLRLRPEDRRTALMAGVAGGFGAVFGTPLAGAVFAMEVLAIGSMSYDAILPCLTAGLFSDWICRAWGVHHTDYHIAGLAPSQFDAPLALKVAVAAVGFGLASALYAELAHGLHRLFHRVRTPMLRPILGGGLVIALVYLVGTRDFLGLGVTSSNPDAVTILSSFREGGAHAWSWFWKMIFTSVTLGSGFKGGEVTPIFYIGAALGNAFSRLLSAPAGFFAALGFVGVFAGATNTPLACTIMGVELFGSELVVPLAVACFVSYLFSGHSGIYLSQRIGISKTGTAAPESSLRSARDKRAPIRLPSLRRKNSSQEPKEDAS